MKDYRRFNAQGAAQAAQVGVPDRVTGGQGVR